MFGVKAKKKTKPLHPIIEELADEMKRRKWSAQTLSLKSGYAQSNVYEIFDGIAIPKITTCEKFAKLLGKKLTLVERNGRP